MIADYPSILLINSILSKFFGSKNHTNELRNIDFCKYLKLSIIMIYNFIDCKQLLSKNRLEKFHIAIKYKNKYVKL